jgi:hypothetical protein
MKNRETHLRRLLIDMKPLQINALEQLFTAEVEQLWRDLL